MNNKKSAIAATMIMAGIGFGLGGGVSIISNTPIFLTTLTFTSACAFLTAAQTGLIAEVIEKRKNKKINNDNVELHPAAVEHVQELAKEKKKKMTQEKIDEIHAKGKLTPDDMIKEWESLDLCAPGDAIGSAAHRCHQFNYNCHECLTDYAYEKEEYEPIEFKVCNALDSFMEKQTNDENQNLVDSAIELHNELNGSNYDLDSLRRIYSKTPISDCFIKDNPSNCDTGSVAKGPVKKLTRN